ncbi:MAG: FAD-dependent monooxygenase [Halofilum sp. (in: g-proteobacteria)]|nr:FAD-dependent monooxygenase [Halofilum sp. (in: g-proteobacteria)]
MTTDCDILISGGGPAGAALALALADGRRRVVVVEPRAEPPSGDARATALAEGSIRLLDALDAWEELSADAVPIHRVEVSQQGHFGRTRLDAAAEGVSALGRVVAYDVLARVLSERARNAAGVEWQAPAAVTGAMADAEAMTVQLAEPGEGGATLPARRARLVIAADGTGSPLRTALAIGTRVHDYEQTAILADVECAGDPHTAHERFTADGPLAVLPAGGARRTLVWTVPSARAPALLALGEPAFRAELATRLGHDLAPRRLLRPPASYPLRRIEAHYPVAYRACLVGNAARTLHPVAAQGFNLALRDVCELAAALATVEDPGDEQTLQDWLERRGADQWRTRTFTDLLARWFAEGGASAGGLRAGALLGLDLCPAGRHALAAQNMGLLGRLPRVGRWRLEPRP